MYHSVRIDLRCPNIEDREIALLIEKTNEEVINHLSEIERG